MLHLFLQFLKIGIFGFGGGLAMLPLIFQVAQELLSMSTEEFANLVVLSQITPGPIAINAATYVGYEYGGLTAATIATFGVSSPSFFIVLAVSNLLEKWKDSKICDAVFEGIKPAVVGLIAAAAFMIGKKSLVRSDVMSSIKKGLVSGELPNLEGLLDMFNFYTCSIFAISLFLMIYLKLDAIKALISSCVCGVLYYLILQMI